MRVIAAAITAIAAPIPFIIDSAHAQPAAPGEEAHPAAPAAPDEIVVTASRREQTVISVPMSIQAVSGDRLADTGINQLTDLKYTVPGYLPQTSSGFTQIFIRGIGNSLYLGADPSVATFVDDVPRIYGTMADTLSDVERIEVLKGAQGGLYGRNTTGGVVNIVTRQPSTEDVKASARISYGEKETFKASAFVSVPLSEQLAVSLAADRASHDAYIKNRAVANPYTAQMFPNGSQFGSPQQTADFFNAPIRPRKVNNQDFWAVSGKILARPTDDLKITLAADYFKRDDTSSQGFINTTPELSQAFLTGLFDGLGIVTNLPPGFVQGRSGKFTASRGADFSVATKEYGFSGTVVWSLPGFDVTSITAYRRQRTFNIDDVIVANVPTISPNPEFLKRFTYQELRAVSTFDGPLRLLFGATYLDNELSGTVDIFLLSPTINIATTEVADKIRNVSIYGEVGYDFTDALSLTVSGRYMHEKNRALFTQPVVASARFVQKKFIPSATLSYRLDNGTAYLRWARGFKTGGINLVSAPIFFPDPRDGSVFDPETVDTFEAGYRQSLMGGRLQVTSAIFYNDYRDLQVSPKPRPAFPAISTAVINANSARTWGIEGSVHLQATDALALSANAGYLNARYKDFKLSGSTVLSDFDLSGTVMPKAPKWQLSFGANLDQPVNDDLRIVGSLLVPYTSRVLYINSALPGVLPDGTTPGYWLVNARIGVKTSDDRYGLFIAAENLFNKGYFVHADSLGFGNQLGWGNPRIIRAELTADF